jgi:hypothetical protein
VQERVAVRQFIVLTTAQSNRLDWICIEVNMGC